MSHWKRLGQVAPEDLTAARLELHHAIQIPAIGVGRHLVPQRDDDSNTSLQWRSEEAEWIGEEIPGTGVRAGLRPADLALLAVSDGERREFALVGKTVTDGVDWLKQNLDSLGVGTAALSMEAHYEMPDHPVATGQPFSAELASGFAELRAYFNNASGLIEEVAESAGASAVTVWPHHFDIATLITVSEGRTVGVGLSPGDDHYPVPYFYVNAYPAPESPELPALPGGGEWHRKGWTGAVLQAPRLTANRAGGDQERQAREFLDAAIAAARATHVGA